MTTYTLSLSRWHKVAERLARKHLELTQAAKNVFLNTQVSGYLGEGQVARLQSDGARALADIQKAFQVQDGVMAIRQAIGDANARVGVATLLAQHDAMSRRQKLLEAILAGPFTQPSGERGPLRPQPRAGTGAHSGRQRPD